MSPRDPEAATAPQEAPQGEVGEALAPAPQTATATVAIVGRPNVGKSTLFNRLVGRRQAIVHDRPGITRDRITGRAELAADRVVEVVDTGGLVPGDDPLGLGAQVLLAVEESDLLLLVVDGREGLVPADETVWQMLRRYGKPTVGVVNKGDTRTAQERFAEFYRLGLDRLALISAEHATGVEDLREMMLEVLAETLPQRHAEPLPEATAVAIVGRPNVGKSSLLNRIVGAPRSLVAPEAGTTRDPVDTVVRRGDHAYLLIDTAGIRRRAKVADAPEELAVMMARRQIERAQVAVLVVDATAGVTSGDLAIAGSVWELGRAAVVLINKWDLLDAASRERLEESWPRLESLLSRPPRINVSALTGRGLEKLFPAVDQACVNFHARRTTGELNRIFETAVKRRRPPAFKGRPWKLYYATQVGVGPPTFILFANRVLPRSDTYRRYLENQLRAALELPGVPVRLVMRRR